MPCNAQGSEYLLRPCGLSPAEPFPVEQGVKSQSEPFPVEHGVKMQSEAFPVEQGVKTQSEPFPVEQGVKKQSGMVKHGFSWPLTYDMPK